ncbi:MAG: hypothetical protein ACE5I1_25660 [bacterium]
MRSNPGNLFYSMLMIFFLVSQLWAQGPLVSYYYNPATELAWAQCYAYQEGGSRQKIPFLPVVSRNYQRCPLGISNYSKDIDVDATLVFVGNGIVKEGVWNSYTGKKSGFQSGNLVIADNIVMFCYDFPDSIEKQFAEEFPLTKRISEAAVQKAAAVVIFSNSKQYPFLYASYKNASDIPDIPVITITKSSALNILSSAGIDGETLFKKWEQSGQPPVSRDLIARLHLKIKGNFEKIETANFHIRFRSEVISKQEMQALAQTNEKAITFLFDCFKEDKDLKWQKEFIVYFRGFDSKLFYTHHWGMGLSSNEGIFNVQKGGAPEFGLAVHENMHTLAALNWGGSSSFLSEGIAKHAEALATNKDDNHLQTVKYMKEGKLYPLKEMVRFNIGIGGLQTQVGYPAAGSFVGFLLEAYGLSASKNAYSLENRTSEEKEKENSWKKAYGKSLQELEKQWHSWLAKRYKGR